VNAGGQPAALPLTGTTVVEVSSFVAAPLCGMTLAQLGAEVIRVDPIGGASDFRRWPLTASGTSIYWTGLNKGKRSATLDLRSPDGQGLVQRLIVEGDGIVVTNAAGLSWLGYEQLAAMRSDVIHVQLVGRGDGSTGVDYTVNAAIGFPLVTGPVEHAGPVTHVLPAWDVCRYAQQRSAFGKPIAEHQAIAFALAEMATKVEAAHLMMVNAARLKDSGERNDLPAGVAKYLASEFCSEVTQQSFRIHGGYGYSKEYEIERLMRDAPFLLIGEGTSEIQKQIISKRLLAEYQI
jgi:hypothetical protein